MSEEEQGTVGENTGQEEGTAESAPADILRSVPASGGRAAFRFLRRELTDKELESPGVQKLLLDALERADDECQGLREYQEKYHERDKRASVLEEKQNTVTSIEICFGVGLAIGGALLGVAPSLWDKPLHGQIALILGAVILIGVSVVRLVKR